MYFHLCPTTVFLFRQYLFIGVGRSRIFEEKGARFRIWEGGWLVGWLVLGLTAL